MTINKEPSEEKNLSIALAAQQSPQFEFYGRHLLLNFAQCRVDLNDLEQIRGDMITAVAAVGATIVGQLAHRFEPQGVSVVLMLSESHASVHTYPECGSCFLDIFTCGENLPVELFGETLIKLWQPERVSQQLAERYEPSPQPMTQPITRSRTPKR